jgi:hypothetical protein
LVVLARADRRHMNVIGLFRNLKNIDDPGRLDITYKYSKTESIQFVAAYQLGLTEMRVTQALIAMCSRRDPAKKKGVGKTIFENSENPVAIFLREAMRLDGVPMNGDPIGVNSSYRQLQREMGLSTKTSLNLLKEAVKKLFGVAVFVTANGITRGFHLLTYFDDKTGGNEDGGQFNVGLNPLIAEAMAIDGQFGSLNMPEVRAIKSETLRFLHQHLCGFIDPGKATSVGIDKLCLYSWPEPSDNVKTMNSRRASVKKALTELSRMGWKIGEVKKDIFRIGRPKLTDLAETEFIEHKKSSEKKGKK